MEVSPEASPEGMALSTETPHQGVASSTEASSEGVALPMKASHVAPAPVGRRGYRPSITINPARRSKVSKSSRIQPGDGTQHFRTYMEESCRRLRQEVVMGRISHVEAASKFQVGSLSGECRNVHTPCRNS